MKPAQHPQEIREIIAAQNRRVDALADGAIYSVLIWTALGFGAGFFTGAISALAVMG